jgi:DeoR family fructose operon transcriptional repressor
VFAEERQRRIAELVSEAGRVNVTDLAADFDITTETVRRDLAALEKAGVLQRVHGGAVPCRPHSLEEPTFDDREIHNLDEKTAIARIRAEPAGGDDEHLRGRRHDLRGLRPRDRRRSPPRASSAGQAPRQLRVITNSLSAIDSLAGAPGVEIFVLPGRFRPVTRAMVGPQTITAIEGHRVDLAVLGTNGLSGDGVSTPDHDEAATKSAFVHSGRRVAVLADSAKFDAVSLVRFAELDQIDVLITDDAPEESLSADLETAEVEVVTP